MNVVNMLRLSVGPVAFAIFLGGCATSQPIHDLLQPQSSGFGIEIALEAPIALFTSSPSQVFSAKIDGEDGILQQSIIRSNYVKDGRAYLLNAKPGTYAAVATFVARDSVPAAPPSLGVSVSMSVGRTGYTTYFSKELVEHTVVTVGMSDFIFMGKYIIGESVGLEGADAVQIHYQNVIAPGATTGGILHFMSGDYHYRGTLVERKNDEETRNEFFRNAKEDLAGSGWVVRIK